MKTIPKIGVLTQDLGLSQLNFEFISQTNSLYFPKWSSVDVMAFYENLSRTCLPLFFACMNIKEAWSYDGITIATSLSTARKLINFPGPKIKLFYVYDLEWVRPLRGGSYSDFADVYCNKELILLTRSESYAKIIERSWNVSVKTIIPNFNMKEMVKLCESLQSGHENGYTKSM